MMRALLLTLRSKAALELAPELIAVLTALGREVSLPSEPTVKEGKQKELKHQPTSVHDAANHLTDLLGCLKEPFVR